LWVDPENREQVGGYKLGFADVVDGELVAVPRGLMTAAAVLAGARGGVDIPEADREGVVRVLSRYYDKMDREVPEGAKAQEEAMGDMEPGDKPRMKNEQMMALRDHLVQAAALVDAMLEGYEEGEEEEMPEPEAEGMHEEKGGSGQDFSTPSNLVEALNAAMAAIKGK
jgi:hypothetical protein